MTAGWKTTEFWITVAVNLWAMFGHTLPPSAQAVIMTGASMAYAFARALVKMQPPPAAPPAVAVAAVEK